MNILIASVFSIDSYSRGIMPDLLQSQLDKFPNANIYYLTCSNTFDVCYFNIQKKPDVCYRCKTGVKNTLKLVSGNFNHIRLKDIISPENKIKASQYYSDKPIVDFNHTYENFEVGAATLSTYISRTRDRDLLDVDRDFVKELAINALSLYLGLQEFLEKEKIDIVYSFNGRQDYVRAVLRASLSKNINCFNLERARLGGNVEFYKNVLPHNILYKANLVEQCWENSNLPEAKKREIGASFFNRQKSGESIIFSSFTRKMKKNVIPDYLNNGNSNIVLFNSSDDEFAALGEEYENPFFRDQNEGLQSLTKLFGDRLKDYNLIIRMHPNLVGVTHEFVNIIRNLHQTHPNIYVVTPESSIDTYMLMDHAQKVITFGSTTGLEAAFKEIPVILLGKAIYYYSDVAYIPSKKEEIESLLKSKLQPKPLQNALKFGFYFLKGGKKAKYYFEDNLGKGIFFKGVRIHSYSVIQRLTAKIVQKAFNLFKIRLKI